MADAPTPWPAIWSAAAATASALTALLTYGINRRNARDGVRPDLVIEAIAVTRAEGLDRITIGSVRNAGRGAAVHVFAHITSAELIGGGPPPDGAPLVYVAASNYFPFVGPGDKLPTNSKIIVRKAVFGPALPESPLFSITLQLRCVDSHENEHITSYNLVYSATGAISGAGELAPGLSMISRLTRFTPAWRVRLRRRGPVWKERWAVVVRRVAGKRGPSAQQGGAGGAREKPRATVPRAHER